MNSLGDIFKAFCKFVDERIFPEENAGTYVAFVVDQAFIDEFCKIYSVKESMLMSAVRSSLYNNRRDNLYVKGMLAIQLYAASKRANEGTISEKNYRDRLSQVLDWNMYDLQDWMKTYQEDIWESLYNWCDRNYFQITKCKRRTGTGRYVQYPINQALRVFTEEDLKYIASCFVARNLSPGEDIQKRDFRKLISRYDILHHIQTNHAKLVIDNSITDDDYYNQVYNFFLRWNGDFKERAGKTKNVIKKDIGQLYMYLPNDLSCLELRTAELSLEKTFDLSSTSYETIVKNYNFKRKGVILFKRDDVYDNYWQEVRYLEGKEKEGLIVCYYKNESDVHYRLRPSLIHQDKHVQIFKVKYDYTTRDFYSDKRFYELVGGLKIGRQIYLHGAAPILKLGTPTRIWIDGKAHGDAECEGDIILNYLSEGHHYIKIQDYKKLEFDLVKASASTCDWMQGYFQWHFDKSSMIWESTKEENGIVGLDYPSPDNQTINTDAPILRRWTNQLTFGQHYEGETNITLRIIKQSAL